MTPSCRFPLLAGGTEPLRGSPRESGGNLKEGGNQELWLRDRYNKKEGQHNLPPSLSGLDAQCLTDRRPLQALQALHPRRCRSFQA